MSGLDSQRGGGKIRDLHLVALCPEKNPEANFPEPWRISPRVIRWKKSDVMDWVKNCNKA